MDYGWLGVISVLKGNLNEAWESFVVFVDIVIDRGIIFVGIFVW